MGGIWQAQSNFTKGEVDPLLLGRTDLQSYYQAVIEATNVKNIPQGGLQKRGGFKYIGRQITLGTAPGRLERFSFNVEQEYLFVFSHLRFQIYRDDVLLDPIDGTFSEINTPYTSTQLQEFDFIQSADTIIITHPDVAPHYIQRVTDNNWTFAPLALTDIPQFDFNDASSPAPTSEIQDITFSGYADGDTFKLSLEGILTDEITYQAADTADTAEQMQKELQRLPGLGSGVSVVYSGAGTTYTVTFADGSAKDWRLLTSQAISATGSITDNRTTAVRTQAGVARTEDVWSNTRGWPVTCTFHEARLYFGGSKSRPSTIWGSRVNDPFNFDAGRARPDEALEFTLLTDQVNAVTNIISNRTLQIFTSGAEFYVPESPVTPENISVKPQTNIGAKRLRPVVLEGATMFMQRTGKALYQFQFINEFQANESRSLSILAPHLIQDPNQMAVERGNENNDANYVYLSTLTSGDLTVFNSNTLEGVQAFTRIRSPGAGGKIVSTTVVDNSLYVLVERTTDVFGTSYYIEKEVQGTNTDSHVTLSGSGITQVTGLDHLTGTTVVIKADGAVQPSKEVVGGAVDLDRPADEVELGLEFNPAVKLMPFNVNLNDGPHAAQKKRIMRCAVQQYLSNGIIVNGERLADKTTGLNQFDAPVPQTGLQRVYLHGWSLEAQLTIAQDTPFDMTILALYLEVKT